jgi:hypothetical protein
MMKSMETIYEKASDTAKKIRKVLKEHFPHTKFSVTSDRTSVSVKWTDGPMKPDVEAVLKQFESRGPMDMSDYRPVIGYMWEGKRYVGADYVHAYRTLTPEYKARIIAQAKEMGMEPDVYGSFRVDQLNEAERALLALAPTAQPSKEIKAAEQEGRKVYVRIESDTFVDSFLMDRSQVADVVDEIRQRYPFLKRFSYRIGEAEPVSVDLLQEDVSAKVVSLPAKRVENMVATLTPEQLLKLLVLQKMLGEKPVAQALAAGVTIDQLFAQTAEIVCAKGWKIF